MTESQTIVIFEVVVHNFGRSDDDILYQKNPYFNICRCGLMPNLIKKSWTVSILEVSIDAFVTENGASDRAVFPNPNLLIRNGKIFPLVP